MGQEGDKSSNDESTNGVPKQSTRGGFGLTQSNVASRMSTAKKNIVSSPDRTRHIREETSHNSHHTRPTSQKLRQQTGQDAGGSGRAADGNKELDSSKKLLIDNGQTINRSCATAFHRQQPIESETMQLPSCQSDWMVADAVTNAPLKPPVTTETLKELDLHYIQNNINLRIDVNFDHDLHFMPISGMRGEEKRNKARQYWLSLEAELRVYEHASASACHDCGQETDNKVLVFPQRLPLMFEELRELLLILVPDQDHDQVKTTLDVNFIMQQLRHGVLDILKLSSWLNNLLTSHCAPVRDEWADEMTQTLAEGALQANSKILVEGLEKLFYFCEAMRLDVANHQIRTFRNPLIEDGISFQRDYFKARIKTGRINVESSRRWFDGISRWLGTMSGEPRKDISVFVCGLIELCVFPVKAIPTTLRHETVRLQRIQEEIQDLIQLRVCCDALGKVVERILQRELDLTPVHTMLKLRVFDLVNADAFTEIETGDLWDYCRDSISLEITRTALNFGRRAGIRFSEADVARYQAKVNDHLVSDTNRMFQSDCVGEELVKLTSRYVSIFSSCSAVAISEAQQNYARGVAQREQNIPVLEDIARRLAHTTVIHWRVWSDLAYTDDPVTCIAAGVEDLSVQSLDA